MNTELQILPEIAGLLPPLSEKEFSGIEADILQRGVISPLVVWNDVLVDGHHRYQVCTKHSLPFPVRRLDFDSVQSAKIWAWQHQENHRNLTPFQRIEIALQFKPHMTQKAKERQTRKSSNFVPPTLAEQIPPEYNETRDELAELAKVSHGTFDKAEYITANADESTKAKLRSGDTTINAEYKRLKKESELIAAKQKVKQQSQKSVKQLPPAVFQGDGIQWISEQKPCDLLLTDPPYKTDVPDIEAFANHWLPAALSKVKPSGSAYVFTGAYPQELKAYLNRQNGSILHAAVAKSEDIYDCIRQGFCGVSQTGEQQQGRASFFIVDWDTLRQSGKWLYEFPLQLIDNKLCQSF